MSGTRLTKVAKMRPGDFIPCRIGAADLSGPVIMGGKFADVEMLAPTSAHDD